VNDVSCGRYDSEMLTTVSELRVPYIGMHMRGTPKTMMSSDLTRYEDVTMEVAAEINEQLSQFASKIPRWLQIVDPGIGFAKGFEENVELLKPNNLLKLKNQLQDRPLLIGVSRKKFIRTIVNNSFREVNLSSSMSTNYSDGVQAQTTLQVNSLKEISIQHLDGGTAGVCCAALLGGADILRVHNVAEVKSVCSTFNEVMKAGK
jgi:dihydropteroate synthase